MLFSEKFIGLCTVISNFTLSILSINIGTTGILNFFINCAGIVVVNAFSLKKGDFIPSETLFDLSLEL